ncbi:hypothetical protein GYA19_00685, partial [Candidatus Beckwithbacteria bacterium]|nr:hypothetical protein [Candidatus Beckwithbacteria bacterium]
MKIKAFFKKYYFQIILTLIFFGSIFIIHYYFFNNTYFGVHDFTVGARLFEQHQTILDGQFPPRWAKDLGFGYGMPLFQFYAPL